jgi:hypothetical protein
VLPESPETDWRQFESQPNLMFVAQFRSDLVLSHLKKMKGPKLF